MLASISLIRNADGVITHYVAVEEDATARKEAEERLSYLPHFDALTGLPNRIFSMIVLSRRCSTPRAESASWH